MKATPGKSQNRNTVKSREVATRDDRRHSRFVVSLPVRCTRVAGRAPTTLCGRTADVGSGGLAVELPTRVPPGTRVTVEIQTGIGPMRMEADVVWTRRAAGRAGATLHGICLADRSEILDLPIHVLLGQWLRGLAKRERGQARAGGHPRGRRRVSR